jgi:hypothetical protein
VNGCQATETRDIREPREPRETGDWSEKAGCRLERIQEVSSRCETKSDSETNRRKKTEKTKTEKTK